MQKNDSAFKYYQSDGPPEARIFLLLILGLIASFLMILLGKTIVPYPAILEETVKALLILFLICGLEKTSYKVGAALMLGVIIGLSENIFYLTGSLDGSLQVFWLRMLIVVPMHIITTLIILLPTFKRRYLIVFGWLVAMLVHTAFNNNIDSWMATIIR